MRLRKRLLRPNYDYDEYDLYNGSVTSLGRENINRIRFLVCVCVCV